MSEPRSAEAARIAESRHDAWSEVQRLRSLNRDLISLLAQPAIGTGQTPAGVVQTLVEVLMSMLRVDLAYARVASPGEAAVEAGCASAGPEAAQRAPELGVALERWLKAETWNTPVTIESPLGRGEMRLLVGRFGLQEDSGVVAVGSRRQSFPTETEALLFRVAINQAVIGFREAQVLQEHQRGERLALEAASLGTWDYHPLTGDMTWSDRCKELFGLAPDAKVDYQVFLAGLHPEDRERTHQAVQRALAAESGGRFKIEYRTVGLQDAIERWVSTAGRAFFDGSGRALRCVGTVLDITERKRVEVERELLLAKELAARAAAEEAIHLRDEFLSVASHELYTPITSLMLSVEALLPSMRAGDVLDPRAVSKLLDLVSRQGRRLIRLIGDLLDVSRIETGRLQLDVADVELGALVREVVERLEADLARHRCSLSIRASGPVCGRWDRSRLDQVVTNLLSNAMKFGSGKPVEISIGAEHGVARLAVKDSGIGVSQVRQERIFERFERAAPPEHYGGLGLGLYISRRIVRAHGGSIRVESEPGAGSTFTVELPCAGPPEAAGRDRWREG